MKKFISALLLTSLFSQIAFADVAFVEGKDKRPSAFALMVIPDGVNDVKFAISVNGQFHRYLANEKSFNIAQLTDFSNRQEGKVFGDRIRKISFAAGGTIVGIVLGAGATEVAFRNTNLEYLLFYFLTMGIAISAGAIYGGMGGAKLHDAYYVTGSERVVRGFFTSAQVTSDKFTIYETKDAVLTLAQVEKALEEFAASQE